MKMRWKTHESTFNGHENRDFRFHGVYLSHEISFSNSLIIHIVISLPERPILVRWMSLETQ